jgi:predicted TPR repeat methyltransferase
MSEATDAPAEAQASPADLLLKQAMDAHMANRREAARALYLELLAMQADHPDGLHLLGVLEGQSRNHDRAVELIARAIAVNPQEPMFHNNLGNVCQGAERFEEAELHYRRAIELDPGRYDAINNVAVLQGRRGDLEGAEKAFLALLESAPGFADARQNLANLYLRGGRVAEAVEQCAMGLVTAPRNRAMRRLLGSGYSAMGLLEQATELYRKWVAEEPDSAEARHHLAAHTGQGVPAQASKDYVRAMFDTFAGSFDAKLASLDYRAPSLVAQALGQVLGEPQGDLRVADMGCGTGLCGSFLAPYASHLVGVDLSPPMLAKAQDRGLYHALYEADLTEYLQGQPGALDLIVSADTLCYFGALEGFATAAAGALAPEGLLVFTVEAHDATGDAPPWRLLPHGRYSHRRDYVTGVLEAAGLAPVNAEAVVLRQEAGQPVHGWLVVAGQPQAAEGTQHG